MAIKGPLAISLAGILWGGGYFFRKTVLGDITPALLSFLSLAIACLSLFIIFRPSWSQLVRAFRQSPWLFVALGLSSAIAQAAMYDGLEHSDLSIALIFERIQPVIALFLAAVLLKEYIPRRQTIVVVIAIVSSGLLLVEDPMSLSLSGIQPRGVFGITLAATSWAFATIIGRAIMRPGKISSPDATTIRFAIASLCSLPFVAITGELSTIGTLTPLVWAVTAGCAVFSTAVGYLLYTHGLKTVDGAMAGMLEFWMPATAVFLGVTFLGDKMSPSQMIAGVTLVLALLKLSRA